MIYLVTGAPGSGKTLYSVSTLVQDLVNKDLTDSKGNTIKRRLVVDGIPDLVMPCEVLCQPVEDEKGNWTCDEGQSILDWPDWCQPGDVIVIDEVQRYWRPRGMGSKPPRMIKDLETHRHKGVDFVIITQNPMLMDQNVRRLIYQHKHIRRLFGAQRAVIYEWDSCAADVTRVKSAQSTSYWGYPKSAFALYKSSELHTKPKVKIPLWLAVPVVAIIAGVAMVPQAMAVMGNVTGGKGINDKTATVAKTTASAPKVTASEPISSQNNQARTVPENPEEQNNLEKLKMAANQENATPPQNAGYGCVRTGSRCGCFDSKGAKVPVAETVCLAETGADKPAALTFAPSPAKWDSSEAGVLKFAFGNGRNEKELNLAN